MGHNKLHQPARNFHAHEAFLARMRLTKDEWAGLVASHFPLTGPCTIDPTRDSHAMRAFHAQLREMTEARAAKKPIPRRKYFTPAGL